MNGLLRRTYSEKTILWKASTGNAGKCGTLRSGLVHVNHVRLVCPSFRFSLNSSFAPAFSHAVAVKTMNKLRGEGD